MLMMIMMTTMMTMKSQVLIATLYTRFVHGEA